MPGTSRKQKQIAKSKRKIWRVDSVLWFGKHKGKTIRQVLYSDKPYLKWLANQPEPKPNKRSWRMRTLKSYLKRLLKNPPPQEKQCKAPNTYVCRDCGHEQPHYRYEFFRAADPRCRHCGGLLDHIKDARLAHECNDSQESLVGRDV